MSDALDHTQGEPELPWDMPSADKLVYKSIAARSPEDRSYLQHMTKKYVDMTAQGIINCDALRERATKAEAALDHIRAYVEEAQQTPITRESILAAPQVEEIKLDQFELMETDVVSVPVTGYCQNCRLIVQNTTAGVRECPVCHGGRVAFSRIVDVRFEAIGVGADGKETIGVVTARVNVAKQPWPAQKWDGSYEGMNAFGPDSPPIRIVKLLDMEVVDEKDVYPGML